MSRVMKDSGIEWIGEIPTDWIITKVGRLGTYTNGYAFKPEDWGDEGLPIIRIQNLTNENKDFNKYNGIIDEKYIIKNGTLLISWSATLDIFVWNGETALLNQHIYKAEPNEAIINRRYFFWCASAFMKEMSNDKHGTTMQHVTKSVFSNFLIPLPPLNAQQDIANYLDKKCAEVESIIEKIKESLENFKKYKKSIITEAVFKGLRNEVKEIDSGIKYIGSIPSHWKVRKIKNVLTPLSRIVLPTDDVITCFRDGEVTLRKNRRTEGYTFSDTEKGYQGVEVGDLVIHGMDAFAGAIGISDSRGKCTPVVHVCDTKENKRYYMYLLRSLAFNDVFTALSEGVRIRSSDFRNWDKLARILVVLPPLSEQSEIANYLDLKCTEIDNLISKKHKILSELEAYKKSLVYECVTGKRNVEQSEKLSTNIYPLFPAALPTDKKRFAQAVLISKVIDITHTSQLGRVKLEKILYTLETHIGFNFDTDYERQIAGPLDGSIYQCEKMISVINKWFKIEKSKFGVKYSSAKDKDNYKNYYKKYYSEYDREIERIINIFRPLSTDQSEIIATLYASWNDFVIVGKPFTDEDIISDVLNNWHESKKRFSKASWIQAIDQIKELELVPKGYGKRTIREQGGRTNARQ
ncbi:restriction endonuclease subunit S [Paenibacillus chitinolyticus]|uniref:restriction endonuclease subunit S n=1 Tax=Paenibacillus chitinolyticus TaxID=79263 RepID=UPI0036DE0374